MIKLEELKLENRETDLDLDGNESVVIRSLKENKSQITDIELEAFGQQLLLDDFADYCLEGKTEKITYIPKVWKVTDSQSITFCAIVGIDRVVFVDFASRSLILLLKMFRDDEFDRGFFSLNTIGTVDGFILMYESGVARIRNDGKVLWHRRLHWDDIFDRSNASFLYYSNEHRKEGEDWRVRIEDGNVVDGW